MSIAECDEDIVVAMAMHEGRSMGCDLDLEDANVFIFQDKVVRWFRSDFDFNRGLCSQERNQQEEKKCALHDIPPIQAEYTIFPPTIAATTFPSTSHPSNAMFFDFNSDLPPPKP